MIYIKDRLSYWIKSRNLKYMLLLDNVVIIFSIFFSIFIKYNFSFPHYLLQSHNLILVSFFLITKILCFRTFALYRGLWRYTSVWDMYNIIRANLLSTVILITIFLLFNFLDKIFFSLLIIDFLLCTVFVCASRLGIRLYFSQSEYFLNISNSDRKKVIIIGAGDTGQTISKQILQKKKSNISIVAFMDDNPKKFNQRLHGIPVVGPISNILKLKFEYDEIYICVPSAKRSELRLIIEFVKKTGKKFKILPSISGLIEGSVNISQLRDVSINDLLGREEVELNKKSIKYLVSGKRVLITGAGGSIGSELVRQCVRFNPSILIMVDNSELNLFEIDKEMKKHNTKVLLKPTLLDIRDEKITDELFDEFKPQIVLHAAAYKHVPIQEIFPWEAIKTNVFGTFNLAKSSVKNKIEKFVLVSTDKAVKPVNVMGATKRIAEKIMQKYNLVQKNTAFMAVRFGNVLGSSGSVVPIFKEQIKQGGPVTVTDPDMKRYFMSIPEASQLILQAGALGIGGEIFILDMGKPIKIIDLASDLIKLSGFDLDEIPIEITGIRPGEKITEELSNPSEEMNMTKHEKIFVLNNSNQEKSEFENIITNIENLESELHEKNPEKIRIMLSSFLDEYKPELRKTVHNYLKDKENAEA